MPTLKKICAQMIAKGEGDGGKSEHDSSSGQSSTGEGGGEHEGEDHHAHRRDRRLPEREPGDAANPVTADDFSQGRAETPGGESGKGIGGEQRHESEAQRAEDRDTSKGGTRSRPRWATSAGHGSQPKSSVH
jgi:hypothetical protein